MQHAISQCYEMHEAIKESVIKTSVSTGKSSQVEPLYPQSVSTGEIIGPRSSGPVSPSQLGERHSNPIVTTPMIALDVSGTTHLSDSHNVALNRDINQSISLKMHGINQPKQTSFLLTSSTSAEAIMRLKFHLPEEPKNTRFRSHENLRTNRSSWSLKPTADHSTESNPLQWQRLISASTSAVNSAVDQHLTAARTRVTANCCLPTADTKRYTQNAVVPTYPNDLLTTVHATTEHQQLNAHKFSPKNAAVLTASSDDPYC
ncbi:beta-D-xylosidase 4 [Dorcoceras hygrometricum]|uniref:Beta-D-xylosidase 4 n=1 Tax=Dorcoceras hygrometricum TaxID=472368 RepID=A0A2Z7BTV5_9LAMI|nr:beta-D-xylosidase 4 [Dorcoceras hygrometricum]